MKCFADINGIACVVLVDKKEELSSGNLKSSVH